MGNIIVTSIGRDRPGIVAGISNILYQHNANILKTRASILGGLFVMVMVVDISKVNIKLEDLISKLKEKGVELGSGISVEDEKTYRKKKKLVAFDLEGTLIQMETLDELANKYKPILHHQCGLGGPSPQYILYEGIDNGDDTLSINYYPVYIGVREMINNICGFKAQ